MKQKTTIRRIGGSLGVILPKSVADEMSLEEGDELFITTSPDAINLSPFDPDFADSMEDAREFMRSHRNAFRELAK